MEMASSGGSERFEIVLSAGTSSLIGGVGRDAQYIARHITVKRVRGGVEEQTPRPSANESESWTRALSAC